MDIAAPAAAIEAERPADAAEAEVLIADAFGPGRFAKAAERLREGARPLARLVARREGTLVGAVRLWPVRIGATPAALLGPIAVAHSERGAGVGQALVRAACRAAEAAGHRLVVLVGDEAFFGVAGFSAAPARAVRMPGPVDQRRVLVRALSPGAAEGLAGPVTADKG